VTELVPIDTLAAAAAGQWHAMATDDGDVFYPDDESAAWFFHHHYGAEPVHSPAVRAAKGCHVLCQKFPCTEHAARQAELARVQRRSGLGTPTP
jgi:hypothetical protein